MKTILLVLLMILAFWLYYVLNLPDVDINKPIKTDQTKCQEKIDSINYQIKVRDSIIYDLYQENKRLKLQQQNFQ